MLHFFHYCGFDLQQVVYLDLSLQDFSVWRSSTKKNKQKNSEISDLSFEETFFASRVVKINDSTAVCKTLNHQKWRKNKTHFGLRFWRSVRRSEAGVSWSQPEPADKVQAEKQGPPDK